MLRWPFSKPVTPPAFSASNSEATTSLHTPNEVTAPEQIAELLDHVYKHRCLLAVNVDGIDGTYTSAIIEIVRSKSYLVLDELAPRNGNRYLSPRRRLSVRARINSVTLRFEGEVSGIGEESGLPYYQLPFPSRIDYMQRREHFRAGVPMEKQVPVQMAIEKGTLFNGELRDISLGGCSIRLHGAPIEKLAPGTVISRFVITPPDENRICGSGQICYADIWQPTRVSRLGVRFTSVDKSDHRTLEQFIAQLDREMKRKNLVD